MLVSLVLALLLNTSTQFTLLRIICLVPTVVTPLVSFDTQPIGDQHGEQQQQRALRLPEFWVADPVAWFAHVEAHFELENLTSQQHRYFNVVKSLSQDSLRLIKDILANPHPTTPYDILKDRLLNNHSLTDFQKIERQLKMGELGPQQKPSELLAHLVELTPADESKYLIFLFIQRLPKILPMQLGGDLDLDLRDISERANRLWSIHARDMAARRAARLVSLWPPSPLPLSAAATAPRQQWAAMAPRPPPSQAKLRGWLLVCAGSTGSMEKRPASA